jgi:hypothetical protein
MTPTKRLLLAGLLLALASSTAKEADPAHLQELVQVRDVSFALTPIKDKGLE